MKRNSPHSLWAKSEGDRERGKEGREGYKGEKEGVKRSIINGRWRKEEESKVTEQRSSRAQD